MTLNRPAAGPMERVLETARDPRVPARQRAGAIMTIVRGRLPEAESLLRSIAADQTVPREPRAAAVRALAQLRPPGVLPDLVAATRAPDPAVAAVALDALARLGGEAELRVVAEIRDRGGPLGARAALAAQVISHRLGLPGGDVPMPPEEALLEVEAPDGAIVVDPLEPADAAALASTLREDDLPLDYSVEAAYRVTCDRGSRYLALNGAVLAGDPVATVSGRKTLLGVLARQVRPDPRYMVESFVFTRPAEGSVEITVVAVTGKLIWAGRGAASPSTLQCRLRTVRGAPDLRVGVDVTLDRQGVRLGPGSFAHRSGGTLEPVPDRR
jgi:hypothetical protein